MVCPARVTTASLPVANLLNAISPGPEPRRVPEVTRRSSTESRRAPVTASDGTVLGPDVVRQLVAGSRKTDPFSRLTAREQGVLALMAEGQSSTGIAETLAITSKAVEKHVSSVFARLDLLPDDDQHSRRVLAVVRYRNS
jgi:DNA-binding NarL/FixJ family response regulator